VGPEAKLYKKLVKEWREFTFTRLENISLLGTPDLLVYNTNRHFFTIELKVTKGKKQRPLVQEPLIVFKCFVVHASWSLPLVA
jgi:hypothetical protein